MAFLRDEKIKVADYEKQGVLVGEKLGPIPFAILKFFDENKGSSKKIGRFISDFADEVNRIGNPKQKTMFDDDLMPSKLEIINKLFSNIAKDKTLS